MAMMLLTMFAAAGTLFAATTRMVYGILILTKRGSSMLDFARRAVVVGKGQSY